MKIFDLIQIWKPGFISKKSEMKKTLKMVLTEMISVILGILIALLINNWKDNLNDKRFINSILGSVMLELSENKVELDKTIIEHQLFIDTLNKYLRSKDTPLGALLGKSNGFRVINIKNASWKSFLNANMQLVDYSYISELTNIDESKQNMRAQMEKLTDFVYENLYSNDHVKKNLLLLMVNDLLSTEKGLLEAHDECLRLLSQNLKDIE